MCFTSPPLWGVAVSWALCLLLHFISICLASFKLLRAWLLDFFLGLGVISVSLLQELRERVLRGKYRIPFYMSTDCENLLKKFLILNPSKRGTLEVSC